MRLHRTAREILVVEVTTEPPTLITDWQLSVDGGTTWSAPITANGVTGWLVAGPDCPTTAAGQIDLPLGTTLTLLRLVDDPEVTVRPGPSVVAG